MTGVKRLRLNGVSSACRPEGVPRAACDGMSTIPLLFGGFQHEPYLDCWRCSTGHDPWRGAAGQSGPGGSVRRARRARGGSCRKLRRGNGDARHGDRDAHHLPPPHVPPRDRSAEDCSAGDRRARHLSAPDLAPGDCSPRDGAAGNRAAGNDTTGDGATRNGAAGYCAARNGAAGYCAARNGAARNGAARNGSSRHGLSGDGDRHSGDVRPRDGWSEAHVVTPTPGSKGSFRWEMFGCSGIGVAVREDGK